jgi:hypothetical protein
LYDIHILNCVVLYGHFLGTDITMKVDAPSTDNVRYGHLFGFDGIDNGVRGSKVYDVAIACT